MSINQFLKQAQEIQAKLAQVQEKLGIEETVGTAGGGLVTVTLNGKGEMKNLKISPTLIDPQEVEVLEDVIKAAFNDARTKVNQKADESMTGVTGGLKMPAGMKFPF